CDNHMFLTLMNMKSTKVLPEWVDALFMGEWHMFNLNGLRLIFKIYWESILKYFASELHVRRKKKKFFFQRELTLLQQMGKGVDPTVKKYFPCERLLLVVHQATLKAWIENFEKQHQNSLSTMTRKEYLQGLHDWSRTNKKKIENL